MMKYFVIILMMAFACLAADENKVIGVARTPHRANFRIPLPAAMENNCAFWYSPVVDDGANYYSMDRSINDATTTSAPEFNIDFLRFTGAHNVEVASGTMKTNLVAITNACTFFTWIRPFADGSVEIIAHVGTNFSAAGNCWYFYRSATTKLGFLSTDGTITTADNVPVSTWSSVAFTMECENAGNGSLYIDGTLSTNMTTGFDPTMPPVTVPQLTLGAYWNINPAIGYQGWYTGRMGTTLVFNRVLTATEILRIHNLTDIYP